MVHKGSGMKELIRRLQEDKAAAHLAARQRERILEEKAVYDEERVEVLRQIMQRQQEEVEWLEGELERCRRQLGVLWEARMAVMGEEEGGEGGGVGWGEGGGMGGFEGMGVGGGVGGVDVDWAQLLGEEGVADDMLGGGAMGRGELGEGGMGGGEMGGGEMGEGQTGVGRWDGDGEGQRDGGGDEDRETEEEGVGEKERGGQEEGGEGGEKVEYGGEDERLQEASREDGSSQAEGVREDENIREPLTVLDNEKDVSVLDVGSLDMRVPGSIEGAEYSKLDDKRGEEDARSGTCELVEEEALECCGDGPACVENGDEACSEGGGESRVAAEPGNEGTEKEGEEEEKGREEEERLVESDEEERNEGTDEEGEGSKERRDDGAGEREEGHMVVNGGEMEEGEGEEMGEEKGETGEDEIEEANEEREGRMEGRRGEEKETEEDFDGEEKKGGDVEGQAEGEKSEEGGEKGEREWEEKGEEKGEEKKDEEEKEEGEEDAGLLDEKVNGNAGGDAEAGGLRENQATHGHEERKELGEESVQNMGSSGGDSGDLDEVWREFEAQIDPSAASEHGNAEAAAAAEGEASFLGVPSPLPPLSVFVTPTKELQRLKSSSRASSASAGGSPLGSPHAAVGASGSGSGGSAFRLPRQLTPNDQMKRARQEETRKLLDCLTVLDVESEMRLRELEGGVLPK
ncbi:unnamed protein product [Closterium sp. Naga37s-1]|nr:unnamed protein product [Closterium sp. Naga37s-1]